MEKLSSQDVGFLKIESPRCPFHVASLMIMVPPAKAPPTYLRQLARRCGRLNEVWPVFNKKLQDPDDLSDAAWVPADDYVAERHVFHYAVPQPGRMEDALRLVTRAHERPLDRKRPLWEMHLIEGLPGGRFALYTKVHHALVDGVGGMKMTRSILSESPSARTRWGELHGDTGRHHSHHGLFDELARFTRGVLRQSRALPELSGLLAHMGADALQGRKETMRLPFTAPRSLFNVNLDAGRSVIICDLSLQGVRRIARTVGGTVNDVLLAVCGGALREYLQGQRALPRNSLLAGMPVSLKGEGEEGGNRLSYIISPYFTDEGNDLRRLQRVVKTTRRAKGELRKVSATAAEDFYALLMAPTILLTAMGNATLVPPAINVIFSNVPGAEGTLYLDGARVEALYPLSIVTDAMGLNITVISHGTKLCFGVVSCPTGQPGIEDFGGLLKQSYQRLRRAVAAA